MHDVAVNQFFCCFIGLIIFVLSASLAVKPITLLTAIDVFLWQTATNSNYYVANWIVLLKQLNTSNLICMESSSSKIGVKIAPSSTTHFIVAVK